MAILNEYVTSGREIKDTDKVVQYNNLDITGNPNTIFMEVCNEWGIDYNNDNYLNECYNYITNIILLMRLCA